MSGHCYPGTLCGLCKTSKFPNWIHNQGDFKSKAHQKKYEFTTIFGKWDASSYMCCLMWNLEGQSSKGLRDEEEKEDPPNFVNHPLIGTELEHCVLNLYFGYTLSALTATLSHMSSPWFYWHPHHPFSLPLLVKRMRCPSYLMLIEFSASVWAISLRQLLSTLDLFF